MSYSPNFRGAAITTVENAAVVKHIVKNNTGVLLQKLTPVRINNLGVVDSIDVSLEEAISVSGVTTEDILNGASGGSISSGIIEDITTSFNLGDVIYVSKSGDLTNTKPSIGVDSFLEGDYVIKIGVISKNELNPAAKDIYINISIVGQL